MKTKGIHRNINRSETQRTGINQDQIESPKTIKTKQAQTKVIKIKQINQTDSSTMNKTLKKSTKIKQPQTLTMKPYQNQSK